MPRQPDGGSKLRWKDYEWEKTNDEALRLVRIGEAPEDDVDLFMKAQLVLDEKRQRKNRPTVKSDSFKKFAKSVLGARSAMKGKQMRMKNGVDDQEVKFELNLMEGTDAVPVSLSEPPKTSILNMIADRIGESVKEALKQALQSPEVAEVLKTTILDAITTPTKTR